MENFVSIIVYLCIGLLLQNIKSLENFSTNINTLIIYVCLPATVLLLVPKIEFEPNLLTPIITPYVVFAISIIFALYISKRYNLPKDVKASLLLLLPLGNTSFFGFPMIEALINKEAISYAILYDLCGSFMFLSIYGSIIVAIYSSNSTINYKTIIKKVLLFPTFISFVVALIVPSLEFAHSVLVPLSSMLTPLAIISVGYSLRFRVSEYKKPFVMILFVKLLVIPMIMTSIFYMLGFGSIIDRVTLLEVAMPTMITAGALASMSNFAPRFANAIVGYGIIFAFITLPLIDLLFRLLFVK